MGSIVRKKLHIQPKEAVLYGFKTGLPVAAVCGYTRVISEANHDKNLTLPFCKKCERISARLVDRGVAFKAKASTVEELRKPTWITIYEYVVEVPGEPI
jgi:hypothetical protein